MVKKISISLPEDILVALDKAAKDKGISRSRLIAEALRLYLKEFLKLEEKPRKYPTVLWKLEMEGRIKLRSPKRVGKRVRGEWIIEEI